MQRYNNYVLDRQGNALQGVTITAHEVNVGSPGTGVVLQMYSLDDAIVGNQIASVISDAEGKFGFYVENARADLKLVLGAAVQIVPDVLMFDPTDIGLPLDQPIAFGGSQIFSGTGVPTGALGQFNDYYVRTDDDTIFRKTGTSTWTLIVNFHGSQLFHSTGVPSSGLGIDTDYYIADDTGQFYIKDGGAWISIVSLRGTRIFSGAGVPLSSLGFGGDFHINTTTGNLSLKSGSDWVVIRNLIGPPGADGNDTHLTNGVPSNSLGVNGDIAFDQADPSGFGVYYKVAGLWVFQGYITAPEGVLGPGTLASRATDQSIASGSWVTVQLSTKTDNTTGQFTLDAGTLIVNETIPKADVIGNVLFAAEALVPGSHRLVRIQHTRGATVTILGGDEALASSSLDTLASASAIKELLPNDVLALQVRHDALGSVDVLAGATLAVQSYNGPKGVPGAAGAAGLDAVVIVDETSLQIANQIFG